MPRVLLQALDIGFFILHTSIILFNVFGWMWRRTRRANLILLLLTLASWALMGLIYRTAGYCVCTDWHFQVRRALGIQTPGDSYIQFLVWRLTGWLPGKSLVTIVSGAAFTICLVASISLNIRDRRNKKSGPA